MKSTNQKSRRLTTNVSAKLAPDQHKKLVQAATREGVSTSEFARRVLLSAVTVSEDARLQMEFQAVGEERMRLLLAAATKGKDVEAPEVQAEVEHQAFLAAPGLTARRLSALKPSFVEDINAHGEGE